MKKILLALSAVALLFATSCKKENVNPAIDVPEGSFLATIDNGANPQNAPVVKDGMGTMTTIDADRYVIWETGDQISINGSIYTTDASGSSVIFSGGNATGTTFHAFFPATIAGTDAAGTLPATQTIELDGNNNITVRNLPMYATSTNNQLEFHNICAALKITIPAFLDGATRIEVSCSDKAMNGAFTITDNAAVMSNQTPSDAEKMITVQKSSDNFATDEVVYIAVPAQKCHDFKVEFFNNNDTMWCKTIDSLTFEVNKIYNINSTPIGLCFTYVKNANCSIRLWKFGSPDQITLETCTYNASTNKYTNWVPYTNVSTPVGTYIVLNNVGDKVYFRAGSSGNSTFSNKSAYYYFQSTDTVEVSGNIMCLLSQTPSTTFPQGSEYTFQYLFKNMYMLRSAEKLVLPATTLVYRCYYYLFSQCQNLVKAPELPATTLARSCYEYMFNKCYNLTTAPELKATTLARSCYEDMFSECKKLTTAPELPATTLEERCYFEMFKLCTLLVKAPELKATTLTKECYYYMFQQCKSLTDVTMLATSIPAKKACLEEWLIQAGTSAAAGTTKKVYIDNDIYDNRNVSGSTQKAVYDAINSSLPSGGGWTIDKVANKPQ